MPAAHRITEVPSPPRRLADLSDPQTRRPADPLTRRPADRRQTEWRRAWSGGARRRLATRDLTRTRRPDTISTGACRRFPPAVMPVRE
ncbi:hypothetical protein NGM37_30810, partial [Streptomyces sp. TRM76130]|nr:hypothetical protein [Streptomyces sp. TRM76130]